MSMAMLLFAVVLLAAAIATIIIVRAVIAEWREDKDFKREKKEKELEQTDRVVEAIEDDY